jgi:hypothetical protein
MAKVLTVQETTHYFACRVRRVLTLDALGVDEQVYAERRRRRDVDLVTCLINSGDENVAYDLRTLVRPDPSFEVRGEVKIALIVRMTARSRREAERCAEEVLALVEAHLTEYAFDLAEEGEVEAFLVPFPVESVVAVTRRAGLERLDTLTSVRRRGPVGFIPPGEIPHVEDRRTGADTVLHLFPFVPAAVPVDTVYRLWLSQPAPMAISCRMQPTSLGLDEVRFLESQIARCERSAQVGIEGAPEDLSSLEPTLREHARALQQCQTRSLFGLKDNAALMTIEVASPKPISVAAVEALGGLISEPAGGLRERFQDGSPTFLAGGYELAALQGEALVRAAAAFRRVDVCVATHPLAPRGAKRLLHLFDSVEATAAFFFPPTSREPIPGLTAQHWLRRAPPRELSASGCLIGAASDSRQPQRVRLGADDRRRHVYVIGQTGTGKTTLLKSMILDDIRSGHGLCVIDPHGDLFRELLAKIPDSRVDDVVVLDPTDVGYPVGLNLLEHENESERHFVVQELVGVLTRLIEDEYGFAAVGQFAGPLFFQHMRMNLLLAMSDPDSPGTLAEFYAIYTEQDYWRRWLPLKTSDAFLDRWVQNVLPATNYLRSTSDGPSMGSYVGSKFEGFVFDPLLRRIFGQKRSTIDLHQIMDEGKVLLVNLAKGELTETSSRFLGMVLLTKVMAVASQRVRVPEHERRDFHLYVDEFHSLATQSFVTLLSEARKFGLSLVLANQFLQQVRDSRIVEAILGNVGTVVCFRLGQADAERMEQEFAPVTRSDFTNLPNWRAYMTTLVDGQSVRPFSIETQPDRGGFDEAVAWRVRGASRKRYGRPRAEVDDAIAASLRPPGEAE